MPGCFASHNILWQGIQFLHNPDPPCPPPQQTCYPPDIPTKFDPQIHHRSSIRLKGYDYTLPGAYFITLDTWQKEQLFGTIIQGDMHLNHFGSIVQDVWNDLPNHYPHIQMDAFCVMPEHVHGIFVLMDARQGGSTPSPTARSPYGLPEVVRAFKTYSARRINTLRHTPGLPVWQRNYYEHILRGERDLENTRRYILNNPLAWENNQP